MRILIVDDEPPARARLASLAGELAALEVVGEAADGPAALEAAARLAPDIVLLDVRMPGMDGIEVARLLAALPEPPAVVFATAYDEYALRAFEDQAVAYLLKPVRKEKLLAALAQAARLTRPQLQRVAVAARFPERRLHLLARRRDGTRLIPVNEVRVLLAEQKYTRVRHAGGEDLIEDSLRALEEEFEPDFVRIHRNALVSASDLERIERDADGQFFVHVRGVAERLPVSRRMASDLRQRFRI